MAGLLLFMMLAPLLARVMDRSQWPRVSEMMGTISLAWLMMLFWFLCVGLVLDFWNLGMHVAGAWHPSWRSAMLPPRVAVLSTAALIVAALAWSLYEAQAIAVNNVMLRVATMPKGSRPIRIGLISDMHLGGGTGLGRLSKAIAILRDQKPDMILSAGDMIDSKFIHVSHYADLLAELSPPLGKFAVPGNHDYYSGLDESLEFHKAAGFTMLRESEVTVPGPVPILLVGGDDPAGKYFKYSQPNESGLFASGPNRPLTLLLRHRPEVLSETVGKFDLQMSGHTHGGQIFPFSLIVSAIYRYSRGLYELPGGSWIFVSRGTGTWGSPMRLFSPPEVTLITLEPQ